MSVRGLVVEETLRPQARSRAAVADVVRSSFAANPEFSVAPLGANTLQYARSYRPRWATFSAFPLAIVGGLGFLLLLVRRTELCVVTISEDHTGVMVHLTGHLPAEALGEIRTRLASAHAPGGPGVVDAGPVVLPPSSIDLRTPVVAVPAAPFTAAAAPAIAPLAAPVGPRVDLPPPTAPQYDHPKHPPWGAAASMAPAAAPAPAPAPAPAVPAPVAPAAPAAAPAPAAVAACLRLQDGRAVPLSGLVLVGRDPEGQPGEAVQHVLRVEDADRSVSKTHFGCTANALGIWLTDRFSTNGSFVLEGDGTEREVYPGVAVPVAVGTVLRFGNMYARVEAA